MGRQRGYSLIEIMICVAIFGIFAAAAYRSFVGPAPGSPATDELRSEEARQALETAWETSLARRDLRPSTERVGTTLPMVTRRVERSQPGLCRVTLDAEWDRGKMRPRGRLRLVGLAAGCP